MKFKYLLVICCFIFLSLCTGTTLSASVAPEEEWNRTYGEEGYYSIRYVQEVDDGGYILAGSFQPYELTDDYEDYLLIKTDSAGNEEWNKTFGGIHYQSACSATQTRDGGYILAGADEIRGLNGWVVKTDSEGEEEWNRTFRGEQENFLRSVQQTSDGGYIFAGGINSLSASGYDAWVIKTDSNGNEEWNRTFGGTSLENAYFIQETTDGGYILACGMYSLDDTHTAWLVKTDSKGNEEWSRYFANQDYGYNQVNSVKETEDGGYILAGITRPSGTYKEGKAWIIKTNSNGSEEWSRTFNKGDYVSVYSIQQTSDGGYAFAGYSELSVPDRHDSWLIKTDPDGYEEWNKTFQNADDSFINCIQNTRDKGYVLAGFLRVEGGLYRPWLIKLAGEKDSKDQLSEVKELKDYVCTLENVDNSTKTVLAVRLEDTIHHLEKGETEKAVSKLEKFTDSVNKLNLQNKLSTDQANILIQKTQRIIELIQN